MSAESFLHIHHLFPPTVQTPHYDGPPQALSLAISFIFPTPKHLIFEPSNQHCIASQSLSLIPESFHTSSLPICGFPQRNPEGQTSAQGKREHGTETLEADICNCTNNWGGAAGWLRLKQDFSNRAWRSAQTNITKHLQKSAYLQ